MSSCPLPSRPPPNTAATGPRPGWTASTARGLWCQANSSVGENSLHRKSTGMLSLAWASSRLGSGILMFMHMHNGFQHKGFVEAQPATPLALPTTPFLEGHVPATEATVLGSRQRDQPTPHLEITRFLVFSSSSRLLLLGAIGYLPIFRHPILLMHNDLNILSTCSALDAALSWA